MKSLQDSHKWNVYNSLPNETRAGTAPWSSQNETHDTMTNMQHGI